MSATKYVFCHECNRGGNGIDPDKCSCGWQIKRKSTMGCYLGEPIVAAPHGGAGKEES